MSGERASSPGPTTLLTLRAATVRYGARIALNAVDLEVRPGEFVALTGPNGSGKTTLLRVALGLEMPALGGAWLGADPVRDLAPEERALRVAWLPQDEPLVEDVRVEDYVLFGRHPHLSRWAGETPYDREVARVAVDRVGLLDRMGSGVLELSGGERQRLLLARALAQETPLLLLDEPTAHLDIAFQLDLLERVRSLCSDGRHAAVAALHDLNLAARFADRVLVLSHGRRLVDGPPREVLSEEMLRTVWGVAAELKIDAKTGLPFLLPRLPPSEVPPAPGPHPLPGPVHVVGGGGAAEPILRTLVEEGFAVSAGPLNLLDSDAQTADELGVPYPAEIPFAPIGPVARGRHRDLLKRAEVIVVAPFAVGPTNLANLEDLLPYAGRTPMYLVDGRRTRSRDFCDGKAARAADELLARGARDLEPTARLPSVLRALRSPGRTLPPAAA